MYVTQPGASERPGPAWGGRHGWNPVALVGLSVDAMLTGKQVGESGSSDTSDERRARDEHSGRQQNMKAERAVEASADRRKEGLGGGGGGGWRQAALGPEPMGGGAWKGSDRCRSSIPVAVAAVPGARGQEQQIEPPERGRSDRQARQARSSRPWAMVTGLSESENGAEAVAISLGLPLEKPDKVHPFSVPLTDSLLLLLSPLSVPLYGYPRILLASQLQADQRLLASPLSLRLQR